MKLFATTFSYVVMCVEWWGSLLFDSLATRKEGKAIFRTEGEKIRIVDSTLIGCEVLCLTVKERRVDPSYLEDRDVGAVGWAGQHRRYFGIVACIVQEEHNEYPKSHKTQT